MACAVGGAGSLMGPQTGASCARVRAARGPRRRRQGPRAATCPRGRGNEATTTRAGGSATIDLCWLPPVPAGETGARSARRPGGPVLPRPLLVRARWLCGSSIGVGIRAPTSGRRRNGRGLPGQRLSTVPGSSLVVVVRRQQQHEQQSTVLPVRNGRPPRSLAPLAPGPDCAAHGHAQPASRRERAAAEDGGRGWEAARRQPVPQSTGVGGMRAPRSPSRQASFFSRSLPGACSSPSRR